MAVLDRLSGRDDGKLKILVIDDEESILELAKRFLQKKHEILDVETTSSGEEALDLISEKDYDAIVADYKLQRTDGLELLKETRERGIGTLYYLFTARGDEKTSQKALELGANGYFTKMGNPKQGFDKLGDVLIRSIKKRKNEERHLIAWIITWSDGDREDLKLALEELSEVIGFEIHDINIQEISSEKEGIKAYTEDYPVVPLEKKDLVEKWKEIVNSEERVVRAGVRMEKKVNTYNSS